MKILVFGAHGGTGEQVVGQAVEQGHEVTAFVHDAEGFEAPGSVRVVVGDARDRTAVEQAVAGQDAVVDALGGHTPWKESTMETESAGAITDAMQKHGVKRLVVVSAIGVGNTRELVPGWYRNLILPTLLRGAMKDKEQMEPVVETSGLEWTLVRPGHLVDGERTGTLRFFEPGQDETAHKITRADVAAFILQILAVHSYVGQAVNIASN